MIDVTAKELSALGLIWKNKMIHDMMLLASVVFTVAFLGLIHKSCITAHNFSSFLTTIT